ncbi:MAG TPA: hypothetical protein DIT32_05170 [Peptococcaceae bacterium]|nr:hypothetical protein [Peptococcaceae bacterium]
MEMRRFIKYAGILIAFVALVLFVEKSNQFMTSLVEKTFDYVALRVWVRLAGLFLFGLFLGSVHVILEYKADGLWEIDKVRLLALSLPLFALLIIFNTAFMGIKMPQIIQRLLFYIMTMDLIKYVAIFLGYSISSSFTKESIATTGDIK